MSRVHAIPSSQRSITPGTHAEPPHESLSVHGLSSLQGSAFALETQPRAGSQVSVVHPLPSSHDMRAPPVHEPSLAQVPSPVQRSRSSQGPAWTSCWQLPAAPQ